MRHKKPRRIDPARLFIFGSAPGSGSISSGRSDRIVHLGGRLGPWTLQKLLSAKDCLDLTKDLDFGVDLSGLPVG